MKASVKMLANLASRLCVLTVLWAGPAQADLVGHWTLDEGSGDIAADSSGNGLDGVLVGNPEWISGIIDGALAFDRGSYVDCSNDAALDITGPFSAMLWIRPGTGGNVRSGPLSKGNLNAAWSWQLTYGQQVGNPGIMGWQFNADGGSSIWIWTNEALPPGEWYHIAVACDGETVLSYLDGVVTDDQPMTGFASSASPLLIGSNGCGDDWMGAIDDVRLYDHGVSEAEVLDVLKGRAAELSFEPSPINGAHDVPLDTTLTWTPGACAHAHDLYFGLVWDDVNNATTDNPLDVLVSQRQDANTYDPAQALGFGQTYYWRVDEVNGAPDYTVFKGKVWSFTAEPIAIPIPGVTATASGAYSQDMGPDKTIDGSGLDALDQHDNLPTHMWLSNAGVMPAWIQYEFDRVYKLHEMRIWNSNQPIESFAGMGAKDVSIETSVHGIDWTLWEETQLAQGTAEPNYTRSTAISLGNAMARFVRLTINSAWGKLPQCGISEVRFLYVPTFARDPKPEDGAPEVAVDTILKWRAGRETDLHEVYLGTDAQDLPLLAVTTESRQPVHALNYATAYFWQVVEVNDLEEPRSHASDIWRFTTPAYGVVDDFEQYGVGCNRIFFAWEDGLGHNGGENIDDCNVPPSDGNGGGSIVGNDMFGHRRKVPPAHGGVQSMPFDYDNAFGPSRATLSIPGQDWSASAIQTLCLFFHGAAGNTGTLYLEINETKIVYEGDPDDIALAEWQIWNIDLTAVEGIQNVANLTIGVDGENAAGTLCFDDIRLYPVPGKLITPLDPGNANSMGPVNNWE